MTIQFRCPYCQHKLRAPEQVAGQKARCKCGRAVVVPPANSPEFGPPHPGRQSSAAPRAPGPGKAGAISANPVPGTSSPAGRGRSPSARSSAPQVRRVLWPWYAGGGAAALCLVVGVVLLLFVMGGHPKPASTEVAVVPQPSAPGPSNPQQADRPKSLSEATRPATSSKSGGEPAPGVNALPGATTERKPDLVPRDDPKTSKPASESKPAAGPATPRAGAKQPPRTDPQLADFAGEWRAGYVEINGKMAYTTSVALTIKPDGLGDGEYITEAAKILAVPFIWKRDGKFTMAFLKSKGDLSKDREWDLTLSGDGSTLEMVNAEKNGIETTVEKIVLRKVETRAATDGRTPDKTGGIASRTTPAPGDARPASGDDRDLPAEGRADPNVTYDEVSKDPEKFRGKRVSWPARPGLSGPKRFSVIAAVNPEATDARKYRLYVAEFTSQKEVDDVFLKGLGGGSWQITGTIAGKTAISYDVNGPGGVGKEQRKETVPLLVHPRFGTAEARATPDSKMPDKIGPKAAPVISDLKVLGGKEEPASLKFSVRVAAGKVPVTTDTCDVWLSLGPPGNTKLLRDIVGKGPYRKGGVFEFSNVNKGIACSICSLKQTAGDPDVWTCDVEFKEVAMTKPVASVSVILIDKEGTFSNQIDAQVDFKAGTVVKDARQAPAGAKDSPPGPSVADRLEGDWSVADVKTGNNIGINIDTPRPPVVSFHAEKGSDQGTCSVQGVPDTPGGRAYLDFLGLPRKGSFTVSHKEDPPGIDIVPSQGRTLYGIVSFKDQKTALLCISNAARPRAFETTGGGQGEYRALITLERRR